MASSSSGMRSSISFLDRPSFPTADRAERFRTEARIVGRCHPSHSMDGFVEADENALAVAAIRRVIEKPSDDCNPLFLHGGPGTGKTHLVDALTVQLAHKYRGNQILRWSVAELERACAEAQRNQTSMELRQRIWRLDALILDDIHQVAGYPLALEEVYHAFNRLVADNKRIVFASRIAPAELDGLPTTLRNRFESGLIVGMRTPSDGLRRRILDSRIAQLRLRPTRKALHVLIKESRNLKEVMRILDQLAETRDGNFRVSLDEVRNILRLRSSEKLTIAEVAKVTSQYFGVDLEKVRSASRQQPLVHARQVAMYLSRTLVGAALTEIGGFFGGRDHSTVLYACRKMGEEIEKVPTLARASREIQASLLS